MVARRGYWLAWRGRRARGSVRASGPVSMFAGWITTACMLVCTSAWGCMYGGLFLLQGGEFQRPWKRCSIIAKCVLKVEIAMFYHSKVRSRS